MIEETNYNIFCLFCVAMLGLICMLLQQTYNLLAWWSNEDTPEECEDSNCTLGCENCGENVNQTSDELEEMLPTQGQLNLKSFYPQCGHKVDPDRKYLSHATAPAKLGKRVAAECPRDGHDRVLTPQTNEKPASLAIVKYVCGRRNKSKNNILSVKEMKLVINKEIFKEQNKVQTYEQFMRPENILQPDQSCSLVKSSPNVCQVVCDNTDVSTSLDQVEFDNASLNTYLEQLNSMRLITEQIINLQKNAHYVISQIKIDYGTQFPFNKDKLDVSCPFEITKDNVPGRVITKRITLKLTERERSSKVFITELDSQNWEEEPKPTKGKKKKQGKKRFSYKGEHDKAVFSSKQCLSRLACFMTTNDGYSKSKLTMVIEKELKPIKDQINELRDSLTDFNVVNCQYQTGGVKASMMSIQALDKRSYRSKSILTVPSAPQTPQASPHIEPEPKKLSPLAEMYIKLSRH